MPDLLHGQEPEVYGDCAYASQLKLIRAKAPGDIRAYLDRNNAAPSPYMWTKTADDILPRQHRAVLSSNFPIKTLVS